MSASSPQLHMTPHPLLFQSHTGHLVSTSASPFRPNKNQHAHAIKKKMDLKKLNINTLVGPNWGSYAVQVQAAAKLLGHHKKRSKQGY